MIRSVASQITATSVPNGVRPHHRANKPIGASPDGTVESVTRSSTLDTLGWQEKRNGRKSPHAFDRKTLARMGSLALVPGCTRVRAAC
jgi:hypothetical protein